VTNEEILQIGRLVHEVVAPLQADVEQLKRIIARDEWLESRLAESVRIAEIARQRLA
jgi:hypothetical protein